MKPAEELKQSRAISASSLPEQTTSMAAVITIATSGLDTSSILAGTKSFSGSVRLVSAPINAASASSSPSASSTSSPSSSSKSGLGQPGLVAGLISALAVILAVLVFFLYRHLRKSRVYRRSSPGTPNEAFLEKTPRTRDIVSAFPAPPSTSASPTPSLMSSMYNRPAQTIPMPIHSRNGSSVSIQLTIPSPTLSQMPHHAAASTSALPRPTLQRDQRNLDKVADRRSIISWFSLKSKRGRRKSSHSFAWYRSGLDDTSGSNNGDEKSQASEPPPVEMFERASPLTELSQRAADKLWAKATPAQKPGIWARPAPSPPSSRLHLPTRDTDASAYSTPASPSYDASIHSSPPRSRH